MTYDVIVEPRAERDFRVATRWILGQSGSSVTAIRWTRRLRTKIATLKVNPQSSRIDPDSEVHGQEVRVLLHGKRHGVYRILFMIRGDTVHVLTVRHSAQRRLADEMAEGEADD